MTIAAVKFSIAAPTIQECNIRKILPHLIKILFVIKKLIIFTFQSRTEFIGLENDNKANFNTFTIYKDLQEIIVSR